MHDNLSACFLIQDQVALDLLFLSKKWVVFFKI